MFARIFDPSIATTPSFASPARRAGLAKLGMVAIDGSKIRANTSRHKAMSYGRMKKEEARLEREITTILDKMDEVNAEEDAKYGDDDDGSGGLPKALQDREAVGRRSVRCVKSWSANGARI